MHVATAALGAQKELDRASARIGELEEASNSTVPLPQLPGPKSSLLRLLPRRLRLAPERLRGRDQPGEEVSDLSSKMRN